MRRNTWNGLNVNVNHSSDTCSSLIQKNVRIFLMKGFHFFLHYINIYCTLYIHTYVHRIALEGADVNELVIRNSCFMEIETGEEHKEPDNSMTSGEE